ncbi:MAG TPA: M28 family peptidase [Vicinamibacteria bacterium]|nr:M28 family peptidase [Vicinamibacteria bacterium]
MAALLPSLLLASSLSGEAALRHAAALAALGPHPWGSSRNHAAAEYVAAEFREAGLGEVRLEDFESQGTRGANVVGVLRAPGSEFLVIAAHHDTAPEAPGAYDDGGGVGLLIEAARALAPRPRSRTMVFVSFDGEEAGSPGRTPAPGSRAFIRALGSTGRDLVAAFVIEMCGWKGGSPVLHAIAYPDPLRPGSPVIAPAWLVRAVQEGAREGGTPLPLGDPRLSWLYQPTVRAFRAPHHYGDDLSFLQAGLPAVFVSDSSFSAYYPYYHQAGDTADKLDAEALARMGAGVLGVIEALGRAPRGPAAESVWFAAFGRVVGARTLMVLGALSLLPGLLRAVSAGGFVLPCRLLQAALCGVLFWRQPLPVLWILLLPNLLAGAGRAWLSLLSLLPALALLGLGVMAWNRGFLEGTWLAPWEIAALILAVALLWVGPPRGAVRRAATRGGRRLPRDAR